MCARCDAILQEEWVLADTPLPDARCQALAQALRAVADALGRPERDSAVRAKRADPGPNPRAD